MRNLENKPRMRRKVMSPKDKKSLLRDDVFFGLGVKFWLFSMLFESSIWWNLHEYVCLV